MVLKRSFEVKIAQNHNKKSKEKGIMHCNYCLCESAMRAVDHGDVNCIQMLLEAVPGVCNVDYLGKPIGSYLHKHAPELINKRFEYIGDKDMQINKSAMMDLMEIAIEYKEWELLEKYIERKDFHINDEDAEGKCLLVRISEYRSNPGLIAFVAKLLKKFADIDFDHKNSDYHPTNCVKNDLQYIKLFMQHDNFDINSLEIEDNEIGSTGITLLHYYALQNNIEGVKLLVSSKKTNLQLKDQLEGWHKYAYQYARSQEVFNLLSF